MLVVAAADEGPVPVGGAGGSTKVVVKGSVVEALTEAGVGDAEEVLTGALPSGLGDADDDANGAGMKGVVEGTIFEALTGAGVDRARKFDEVAAGRWTEGEVGVKTPNFRSFWLKSNSNSRS